MPDDHLTLQHLRAWALYQPSNQPVGKAGQPCGCPLAPATYDLVQLDPQRYTVRVKYGQIAIWDVDSAVLLPCAFDVRTLISLIDAPHERGEPVSREDFLRALDDYTEQAAPPEATERLR
jgi:hypothetical protein